MPACSGRGCMGGALRLITDKRMKSPTTPTAIRRNQRSFLFIKIVRAVVFCAESCLDGESNKANIWCQERQKAKRHGNVKTPRPLRCSVLYEDSPQRRGGRRDKAGVMKAFFDNITSGKLTPNLDDLKVTRRENVAWTTLTFHLSGKLKAGGSMELDTRHTAIWEKRGGHWLIVHEHISVPLPG